MLDTTHLHLKIVFYWFWNQLQYHQTEFSMIQSNKQENAR